MALSDLERKRIEKVVRAFVEFRRPPSHARSQVDLSFRVVGQSVEILEIRPRYKKPDETMEHCIAKATYVRSKNRWRVFWKRADLKWHRYDPAPEVETVEKFVALVAGDRHAAFFG